MPLAKAQRYAINAPGEGEIMPQRQSRLTEALHRGAQRLTTTKSASVGDMLHVEELNVVEVMSQTVTTSPNLYCRICCTRARPPAYAEAAQESAPSTEKGPSTGTAVITPNCTASSAAAGGLLCVNASSPSLLSTIGLAMKEGRCLLIEDIGSSIDPVLDPVLRKKTFVKVGGRSDANCTAKRGRVDLIYENCKVEPRTAVYLVEQYTFFEPYQAGSLPFETVADLSL